MRVRYLSVVGALLLFGLSAGVAPPAAPKDSDHDGLPDSVETNTGIYVSATNTGTDPHKADTDGDGIPDGVEVHGKTGLNLLAMGFSPVHKDLDIEFHWYDDSTECGGPHSHQPAPGMISRLSAAYAAAPLANPDG